MNLRKSGLLLTLGMATIVAPLASPSAFANDRPTVLAYNIEQSFMVDVKKMSNKDGMVTKKDFMDMMSKKFDAMDKGKKGMLSPEDIMRIFGPDKA